jgi:hypothetical protein
MGDGSPDAVLQKALGAAQYWERPAKSELLANSRPTMLAPGFLTTMAERRECDAASQLADLLSSRIGT